MTPGNRRLFTYMQVVLYILTLGIVLLLLVNNSFSLGYKWQWFRIPRYLFSSDGAGLSAGLLIQGLGVTLKISVLGMLLASFFGLFAALLKLSDTVTGSAVANAYIEAVRNTPLLIQLFFIYFVIAPVFGFTPFFSAVLALGLFEGAYIAEMIRGGILAVEKGQWEASFSLGLSNSQTYRHIVLPQALRTMLPALAGQFVSLVKDSALVSVIAIYDLTMQAQAIVSETFQVFEIWFTVAGIYLVITMSVSLLIRRLEGALKRRS